MTRVCSGLRGSHFFQWRASVRGCQACLSVQFIYVFEGPACFAESPPAPDQRFIIRAQEKALDREFPWNEIPLQDHVLYLKAYTAEMTKWVRSRAVRFVSREESKRVHRERGDETVTIGVAYREAFQRHDRHFLEPPLREGFP